MAGTLCLSLPPSILLILEGIRKGKGESDDSAFGPKQEGLAQAGSSASDCQARLIALMESVPIE